MTADLLFDRFPELFFKNFRDRMLLGMVPAETVRVVFEPLLADFHAFVPALSIEQRSDIDDILRIYPDVAAHFGLQVEMPLQTAFASLLRYLAGKRHDPGSGDAGLSMAAEDQKQLGFSGEAVEREGRGFLRTDRGNCVSIAYSYTEGDDFLTISAAPRDFGIDILIGGGCVVSIAAAGQQAKAAIEELMEAEEKEYPQGAIRVSEWER